ncbi:oxidoreductase-like domain-containing protein [Paraburkholderia oxyphila]|uniref:oxidoreductase-like domain-containing protein n=1 Tax=Paraburkholderia oxyphila TaxID=614212 RepID=UPI000A0026CD|nr:oxidoreductase-like domain-containing protein [Paraburkholderia oxyphila]
MSLPPRPEDDPRPLPPERPSNEDCCQSGCSPCIFDLYDEEVDRWRAALTAWETREAARQAAAAQGHEKGHKQASAAKAPASGAARTKTHGSGQPAGSTKAKAHAGTSTKRPAETPG